MIRIGHFYSVYVNYRSWCCTQVSNDGIAKWNCLPYHCTQDVPTIDN